MKEFDFKKIYKEIIILFISVLLAGIVIFFVKGIWPFGKNTVVWADMTHSLPLFYYWRDVLCGSDAFFFTWRYGLGIETFGIVSQMGFLSPFNIFLLLFEREHMYGAIGVLLLLKIAFMASSMYYYLCKYEIKRIYRVMGAITYSTGMSVLVQNPIVMTLDVAILLPLLMVAYDRMMRERKCVWYSIVLGLILCINTYMGIMVIFFVLVTTFSYIVTHHTNAIRQKVHLFFVASAIGGAFSAIIWVPVLFSFANSSRLSGNEGGIVQQYINILNSTMAPQQMSLVFVNMSVWVACIIAMARRGKFRSKEVLQSGIRFGLMMLAVFVPAIELLWHLGSHSGWAWRFCFILQFCLIDFAINLLACSEKAPCKSHNIILAIITIFAIVWILEIYKRYQLFFEIDKGVLLMFCGLIIAYLFMWIWRSGRRCFLVLLVCVEILANIFVWISPAWADRADTNAMKYVYDASKLKKELLLYDFDKLDRVKDYNGHFASNYASVMEVNSLANWVHVLRGEKKDILDALGYSTVYTRFCDNGGTVFSDLLLGYEYAFSESDIKNDSWVQSPSVQSRKWYEMKYKIPRMFEVSNLEFENKGNNPFEVQNNLYRCVTGFDEELFDEVPIIQGQEVVEIEVGEKKEIYFYADNCLLDIKVNGEQVAIQNLNDSENIEYPAAFNNGIIDLGTFENSKVCIELNVIKTDVNKDEAVHIALMDYEILERGIGSIKRKNSISYKVGLSEIDITIQNAETNNVLFLPILYDPGWKCFVNGERTSVTRIMGGFIGVPITASEMEIKLFFVPQGVGLGIGIFLLLIVVVVCVVISHKKNAIACEGVVYKIVIVGVSAFLLVFYIVPLTCFVKNLIIGPL